LALIKYSDETPIELTARFGLAVLTLWYQQSHKIAGQINDTHVKYTVVTKVRQEILEEDLG
jgi:hypothetical protein